MAFRWLISRIVRLVGQKVNSLFYMLVYREIQAEIVNIAAEIGVEPAELSKEIGRRAARESAERHASILGLVPVNPKNTKKIVQYIETLWYILFGSKLEDYEIEAAELPDGNQKVTFFIKKCPVCMGHEDDKGQFEEAYNAFKKKESEGYACLMAGMLEELARIIMENKNMDIRMDIREVQCFARGDKIMAVEATVIPAEQYENRKGIAFEITKGREDIPVGDDQGVSMESIASESTKLFEKIAETLKIEEIDEFFDTPVDSLKEQIEEFVEGKLHFTPREILEYFRNYEEDVFKVIGYLAIHALNEAGGIISMICSNFILSRILDIIISAFEYGLDTFIPDKVMQDQKEIVVKFMDGWAQDESVVEFK
ncbi:hypothetical protein GF325_05150, partial [Candidatus Bathyarchaeota archaeon]|nr:hypothetical protein [Candidatus Bathyarchaeota archaeon]